MTAFTILAVLEPRCAARQDRAAAVGVAHRRVGRVAGTRFRFGLNSVIGLAPGAGLRLDGDRLAKAASFPLPGHPASMRGNTP